MDKRIALDKPAWTLHRDVISKLPRVHEQISGLAFSPHIQEDSRDPFGIPFRHWLLRHENATTMHFRLDFKVDSCTGCHCAYSAGTGPAWMVLLPNPESGEDCGKMV